MPRVVHACVRALLWLAGRTLRLIPERLLGAVLPGQFSFSPGQVPPPIEPPETKVRLLIAPTNYAGQGWHWSRAAERINSIGAKNMMFRTATDFVHQSDSSVPIGVYVASRTWQRAQKSAVEGGFTHVIIEAGRQPFGAPLDETTFDQAQSLVAHGVRVAMLCHGTEIRLPSRHMEGEPESPYFGMPARMRRKHERTATRNKHMLEELGLPVFVSTPDLLEDVPFAEWLPVVVSPELWRSDREVLARKRPLVVHAPSSGRIKGTELIDDTLSRLSSSGVIDYRRIEHVPHARMPDLYRDADIVLDQFRIGSYGVAACEALAAGRVVIGHVSDPVRQAVRQKTGIELPILEATADELEDCLLSIIAERATARSTAQRGPGFIEKVHDGARAASVLASFLSDQRPR